MSSLERRNCNQNILFEKNLFSLKKFYFKPNISFQHQDGHYFFSKTSCCKNVNNLILKLIFNEQNYESQYDECVKFYLNTQWLNSPRKQYTKTNTIQLSVSLHKVVTITLTWHCSIYWNKIEGNCYHTANLSRHVKAKLPLLKDVMRL